MFKALFSKVLRHNFSPIKKYVSSVVGQDFHIEHFFTLYANTEKQTVNIGRILKVIEKRGIRRTDPRLNEFLNCINELYNVEEKSMESIDIDYPTFESLMHKNFSLLSRIFQDDLIIPDFSLFTNEIKEIFKRCKDNHEGSVATYIPQLAQYSPNYWGLSVCTVDGQRYSIGDVNTMFTLQSCSKPFTYGICLNELGSEIVHKYISFEPSGRHFNEICLDSKLKPHNPMLNSGAIMSCAIALKLIQPFMSNAEKFEFILNYMKNIAGGEHIGFNNSVFLSERETADRNYAMAYYMRENKCYPPGTQIHQVMNLYFQTCSMELTTEALAVMGATLANGGICPITDKYILNSESVRAVLSLMYSCGMYTHSGEFAFSVGLPAKSGVSGALLLVVPNVLSIAMWSPLLDAKNNSVRGQQFAMELVDIFNFHRFDNLRNSTIKKDPQKHQTNSVSHEQMSLFYSASSGDLMSILCHYDKGTDMNAVNYDGRTALHVAAAEGQMGSVRILLDKCKVRPDIRDNWNNTPIHEAERFGHISISQFIQKYMNESILTEI